MPYISHDTHIEGDPGLVSRRTCVDLRDQVVNELGSVDQPADRVKHSGSRQC